MSQSSQGGMALALGIAFAMLIMSVLAPLGWWSNNPTPALDPVTGPIAPRDAVDVVTAATPTVVDGWDELQMLAPEPMLSDFEPLVASKAELRRDLIVEPLPTWNGPVSPAPRQAQVARRTLPMSDSYGSTQLVPFNSGELEPVAKQPREPNRTRSAWTQPTTLLQQLSTLQSPATREYVTAVNAWLQYIGNLDPSQSLTPSFQALRQIHKMAEQIALHLPPGERRQLLTVNYALMRRLRVWELTDQLGDPAIQVSTAPASFDAVPELKRAIVNTRQWLERGDQSDGWGKFLLLAEFEAKATVRDPALRSQLAQRLLARIDGVSDPTQQRFLDNDKIDGLKDAVRRWAADISWDGELLKTLELAEQGDFAANRTLACLTKSLQWSHDPRHQEVGKHLEAHYRNANIRMSFQEEFLNRWVDDPPPTTQPFSDSIMGAAVSGQNHIETEMAVDLQPHPSSWQFLVQAGGVVRSRSTTQKGPATVFSSGLAYYVAEKDMWLTTQGAQSSPARAATDLSTYLDGFNTKFDGVPVVGGLTRTIVQHQHDKQQSKATEIAKQKSNERISREMDLEVQKQLEKATAKAEEAIFKPLRRLKLEAIAMNMSTTSDRATARGRLAGRGQLAAFTPRPVPPSHAMADVQIHQSALNNFLAGLDLDGKRATIEEIGQQIAGKFDTKWTPDEETPKRTLETIVTFAETQPVSVVARGNELRIHLRLTELDAGGNDFWYDFDVQAIYSPVVEGAKLKFVRTKPLSIDGDEFGFRDVIALRGIFAKLFDRARPLVLIGEDIANRKAMQGLEITQCVIENGWLGVAFDRKASPVRTATPGEGPNLPPGLTGVASAGGRNVPKKHVAPIVHLAP